MVSISFDRNTGNILGSVVLNFESFLYIKFAALAVS